MPDNNWKVIIQGVLDQSGIKAGLADVQKFLNNNLMKIEPHLETASLKNNLKSVSTDLAKEINKQFGSNLKGNDVFKLLTQQMNQASASTTKLATDLSRLNKVRTIETWTSGNTKALRRFGAELDSIKKKLNDVNTPMSKAEYNSLSERIVSIQNIARSEDLLGLTALDKLKNAWSKFGGWSIATGSIMRMFQEVKDGVRFIYDLDDAMTDVSYTSDATKDQLEALGNSSVQMAKDLNTSANNILEAVKIYSTANATADDILRKAQPAIMLSNVSGMSGAESSKTIQTSLNQFELEDTEEGLLDIVDTLEYVSSQLNYDFTDGIKEITEGIEASGNVAKNAGLSMQEYATMVGLAVEQTGQSGSTIGNALKTIISRITKASTTEGTLDEDISAAEESLRSVGVQVRDTQDEFRDLTDTMTDVGKIWNTLTSVQKANIGYNVAGIRQLNVLNSIFGSWDSYVSIMENVDDRTGMAMRNQEEYADSLQGHLGELSATGQSIWNNILNSDILESGVDSLTAILSIIDKLTSSFGSLGIVGAGAGIVSITSFIRNLDWLKTQSYKNLA